MFENPHYATARRVTGALLVAAVIGATTSPALAGPAQYTIGNFDRSGLSVWSSASEPSVAVGPYQILTQSQGGVTAYTKDGLQTAAFLIAGVPSLSSDPSLFYNLTGPDPGGPGGSFFVDAVPYGSEFPSASGTCTQSGFCPPPARDPLMMFDPVSQRFFALGWSYTHMNLNISKSSDLRDGWFNYHINMNPAGTFPFPFSVFWDRPSLGLSSDKVVISTWYYQNEILVLDKAALLAGSYGLVSHTFTYGSNSYGTHLDLPASAVNRISTTRPWSRVCVNQSATADIYMLSVDNYSNLVSNIEVARVSGSASNPSIQVYSSGMQVALNGASYSVEQPGTDELRVAATQTNTALSNPFYRAPYITFATHHSPVAFGPIEVRVFEINTSSMSVATDLTFTSPDQDGSYAFASAIRDAGDNVYVGFNASGSSLYPSSWITARKAGESSLESPATATHAGDIAYIDCPPIQGAPCERWGDFTGISLDECPGGRATAYFVGQYSSNQTNATASWVSSYRFESNNVAGSDTTDGIWRKMAPSTSPGVRSGATMTWDPGNNRFILVGGYMKYNGADYTYGDVWSYVPATNTWTYLFTGEFGRANHTAVYVPGVGGAPARIVIFGGEEAVGGVLVRRNDTRALDLTNPTSWTTLSASGPSARASHVAICDPVRNQMIIYGGVPWSAGHTWKFSFATNTWTQVNASQPPAEFEGCSAIYDPIGDRMVVFGGRLYVSASCPNPWLVNSNATYSLSLANPSQWTMHAIANPPPTRAFAAAVYDPVYKRMIVQGGIQDQVCDGGGLPACGEVLEKGLTDAYALTLSPMRWSPIGGFCYDGPTPRGRHSAVYDVSGNKIYAFGGAEKRASGSTCATTRYNDLWRLTLPDVTAPATVTTLSPSMSSDGATITWTAPGDDGSQGTACAYDLRYSTATITAANFDQATPIPTGNPHVPGTVESAEVTDLNGCSWYSFALKTRDGNGNWSGLSNTPKRQTLCYISGSVDTTSGSQDGPALPATVEFKLTSAQPARSDVAISYSIPGKDRGRVLNLSVFDLTGRRVHTLIDAGAEPGEHAMSWNLRNRQGARVKNGIYFMKLRVGDEERRQRVMVVQ